MNFFQVKNFNYWKGNFWNLRIEERWRRMKYFKNLELVWNKLGGIGIKRMGASGPAQTGWRAGEWQLVATAVTSMMATDDFEASDDCEASDNCEASDDALTSTSNRTS